MREAVFLVSYRNLCGFFLLLVWCNSTQETLNPLSTLGCLLLLDAEGCKCCGLQRISGRKVLHEVVKIFFVVSRYLFLCSVICLSCSILLRLFRFPLSSAESYFPVSLAYVSTATTCLSTTGLHMGQLLFFIIFFPGSWEAIPDLEASLSVDKSKRFIFQVLALPVGK